MDYEERETLFFNAIMVSDEVPDSAIFTFMEPFENLDSDSDSDTEAESVPKNPKVRKRLFKNCQFILKSGVCCKLNAKQGKANYCWRHS